MCLPASGSTHITETWVPGVCWHTSFCSSECLNRTYQAPDTSKLKQSFFPSHFLPLSPYASLPLSLFLPLSLSLSLELSLSLALSHSLTPLLDTNQTTTNIHLCCLDRMSPAQIQCDLPLNHSEAFRCQVSREFKNPDKKKKHVNQVTGVGASQGKLDPLRQGIAKSRRNTGSLQRYGLCKYFSLQ